MKTYRVSELKGDEILARPIYLENGQVLLEAGTKLKTSYMESLTELDISEIFIVDTQTEYVQTKKYQIEEIFLQLQIELQEILAHHIYKDNAGLKKITNLAEKVLANLENISEPYCIDMRNRSSNLYEHILYTTWLVFVLGKECNFKKSKLEDMVLGCLLHDLGYFYVNVNYKNCCNEVLTPEENYELKKHPILAYTSLEKENWISDISRKMILFHHEKLDCSGYPLKQKSKELECRMIQICDALDTTVSGIGCQKKKIEEAIEKISDASKFESDLAAILKQRICR